ncbi:hypothetical protein D9M70_548630 [compost metagenome]
MFGRILGIGAHQPTGVGVFEAVEEHMILDLTMPQAETAARLRQQIRGVGHRLHAADGKHRRAARKERVVAEHQRFHAGTADLGDGRRRRFLAEACAKSGLARRVLANAGRQHIAHQHLVDGIKAGAIKCCLQRDGADFRRSQILEAALKGAHRGAGRRNDDDRVNSAHVFLPYGNGWR